MNPSSRYLKVSDLLEFDNVRLSVRSGEAGLGRLLTSPDVNRPALELVGYTKEFSPDRLQILGRGEVSYISENADDQSLQENMRAVMDPACPCVAVTENRKVPPWVYALAEETGTPLLETPLPTSRFTLRIVEHLERVLAARVAQRGVLMDVHGVGVLLMGKSGVGKSECALELVTRGHTFVADDIIEIRAHQETVLMGSGRCFITHHMEIRGIGIIDISRLLGPRAIRSEKQIDLAVTLEDWNPAVEYDRLGIDEDKITILEVDIPSITVPVRPGRSIATIIEVAALNQKLKSAGTYMAQEFNNRLIEAMTNRGAASKKNV